MLLSNKSSPPFNPAYYAARCARLLGFSDPRAFRFGFNDFDGENSLAFQSYASGGLVRPAPNEPSCLEATTAAGAGTTGNASIAGFTSATQFHYFPAGASGRMYGVARVRIPSGSDGNTRLLPWATNSGSLEMGMDGTRSPNWHVYTNTGGTLDSGVPVAADTNFHVLEFVMNAGNMSLIVDEITMVTGAGKYPTALANGISFIAQNGATAALRNMIVDFIGIGFPRPV